MQESKERELRERIAADRRDPATVDVAALEAVPYEYAPRQLSVEIVSDEFTHICPMTGLPDYGELRVAYVPHEQIVELKSFKYYLLQYRQVGIFYEHVVHKILDDLRMLLKPQQISVYYRTSPRGGVCSRVAAHWPERSPAAQ